MTDHKKFQLLLTFLLVFAGVVNTTHAATVLSGYFDTEYIISDLSNSGAGEFDQHHLSLFIQHDVSIFKFFSEIEFEHATELEDNQDGSGTNGRGKVFVENAWGEINFDPLFSIRLGQMLQPTLWQINHYPNLTASVTRPRMVRNIFKSDLIGLMLLGSHRTGFNYKAWTMRGDESTTTNSTTGHTTTGNRRDGFSGGARLSYSANTPTGSIEVAVLAAHYSDITTSSPKGIELNLEYENFVIWSEFAASQAATGFYGLLSYEIDIANEATLAPFVLYDHYKLASNSDAEKRIAYGLNYKPIHNIVVKAEGLQTFAANGATSISGINLAFVYFFN